LNRPLPLVGDVEGFGGYLPVQPLRLLSAHCGTTLCRCTCSARQRPSRAVHARIIAMPLGIGQHDFLDRKSNVSSANGKEAAQTLTVAPSCCAWHIVADEVDAGQDQGSTKPSRCGSHQIS